MRRIDPTPSAHSDLDAFIPPIYADSDAGSSPRSVGACAGRAGSMTEDPPPAVKWDDTAFTRAKLMCSYGGRILPRPHDNQLRYVGGESRIVVVSRNVTFPDLMAKLSRLFGASVAVKYQMPCEDLDALISVTTDEDLEIMMEEYDRLQTVGNRSSSSSRLRLFLFPSKLERSQTSSLSDILESNHTRERWFFDALNGMPMLTRVRSETSSIISETPDYLLQGNVDALEEWAAATSYGNNVPPPLPEQSPDNNQLNSIAATALFRSLLQHSGSEEFSSAPGSPSPLKAKPFIMESSSSAPPAVISLFSAMAEAAFKGQPNSTQQAGSEIDGKLAAPLFNNRRGSGDSTEQKGGGVAEQMKNQADGFISPTSDKGTSNSSVGTAMKLMLSAGMMDDDDVMQKLLAKASSDHTGETGQKVIYDAGVHQAAALKGGSELQIPALMGKPIFDEEVPPVHTVAQNLEVLQMEERVSSPISSPPVVSSASAQILPTVLVSQQPVHVVMPSKVGADNRLKQQVSPTLVHVDSSKLGVEDRLLQKLLRKASSDQTGETGQKVIYDAGVHQAAALKGGSDLEIPAVMGKPIFDEEVPPAHMVAQNLEVLQMEERVSSPISSPPVVSSSSAQILPPVRVVMPSKVGADDRLKQQVSPTLVHADSSKLGVEDRLLQQDFLTSAQIAALKPGGEDRLMQWVSSTPAPFLAPVGVSQQVPLAAASKLGGEDTLMQPIPAFNTTHDVVDPETALQLQQPLSFTTGSTNFYQLQQQQQSLEETMSVTTYATQGPQFPIMLQTPSPGIGVTTTPSPIASFKPAVVPPPGSNMGVTAVAISRPPSPPRIASGAVVVQQPLPQVKTTSPPPSIPPIMVTNVSPSTVFSSMEEGVKGISPMAHQQVDIALLRRQVSDPLHSQRVVMNPSAPTNPPPSIPPITVTNVSPSTVFSSMGEGVKGISPMAHQQVDIALFRRQVSDPLHGQRVAAMNPSAPGLPSRFRAVGHPVQQVVEGIPHQQSPMIGVIPDKKLLVPMQRVAPLPSARPPLVPPTQYSYYMVEQPNALPYPAAAIGGVPMFNAASNIMIGGATKSPDTAPLVRANPFADDVRPVSPYRDVLEVPPGDQQQRHQMRP